MKRASIPTHCPQHTTPTGLKPPKPTHTKQVSSQPLQRGLEVALSQGNPIQPSCLPLGGIVHSNALHLVEDWVVGGIDGVTAVYVSGYEKLGFPLSQQLCLVGACVAAEDLW